MATLDRKPTNVTWSSGGSGSIDTIVIGGGHNGLTCAAYLARAGKRVVVLEALPTVGGYCTSEATVAEAPGFLMNTGGIDHIFTNIAPSVVDDLRLARYGLRYVDIDPLASYLGPDGACLPLWRDLDRACTEIARFSPKDARRYREFSTALADAIHVLTPYMLGHPTRVRPSDVARVLGRAAKHRRSLGTALRILMSSTTAVLDEWFEREEVRSALGAYTSFTLTPIDAPGVGLTLVPIMHRWGLRRPVGGSGAFTSALADCIRSHGGEVRTGAPVREIVVGHGRAQAVVLESGETLHAEHIVGALDPATLLTKLLDPALLPSKVQGELRGMQVGEHNLSCFKADIALRGRPRFPNHGGGDEAVVAQAMLATFSDVKLATHQAMAGELPDNPPVTLWTPTVFDRGLLPPGSTGDSLYLYPIATPRKLSGGRDWKVEKQRYLDRCLDVVEQYAPGTKDLVIGANIRGPEDFGSHNGHIYHVDMLPWQFGPWRPTPSLSGYRTPIEGLWHTAAGAHPVGGLAGWSGRTTARTLLGKPAMITTA
ncbi:phytoene desaturase family protein [Pseudonocardia spinosispora]|uniref:phytoene desaturase family protein n=1 Tax=Pseudonocardia spinosispora TaxID=103441 RepID=UPI000405FA35|nr:NAD(P)/FAD-dependent oxidoreductase [Pseudonocardia spinosispora]